MDVSKVLLLCILLYNNLKKRQKVLLRMNSLSMLLISKKNKKVKQYLKQLKKRSKREYKRVTYNSHIRNQGDILSSSIYERIGLFEDTFEEIYQRLKPSLEKPRGISDYKKCVPVALEGRTRLLMCLELLRENPKYKELAREYEVIIII